MGCVSASARRSCASTLPAGSLRVGLFVQLLENVRAEPAMDLAAHGVVVSGDLLAQGRRIGAVDHLPFDTAFTLDELDEVHLLQGVGQRRVFLLLEDALV